MQLFCLPVYFLFFVSIFLFVLRTRSSGSLFLHGKGSWGYESKVIFLNFHFIILFGALSFLFVYLFARVVILSA